MSQLMTIGSQPIFFNYCIFSVIITANICCYWYFIPENFYCTGDIEERIRHSTGTTKHGANISVFDTDNVYYVSDNITDK